MAVAEHPGARTVDELERQRGFVEYLVGRPLRQAEQAMDVLGLDDALNRAKDDIESAIRAEMRRAVAAGLASGRRIQLERTPRMVMPLDRLFRIGRREAYAELQRAGYEPTRALAAVPEHPELDEHATLLDRLLRSLTIRVESKRVELEIEGYAQDAIAKALLKVPGARDIASRVITKALTTGLSQTFEANQDLVGGWEYTAVLDTGSCDVCAPLDGTEYATLDALFEVLPGFGPNPECLGGDRCRCRAVPIGA